MLPLVWRATFIDVQDEAASAATAGGVLRRARSVPCFRENVEDMFADERSYVIALSRKVNGHAPVVGEQSIGPVREAALKLAACPDVQKMQAQMQNGAVSTMLLCAKVHSKAESAGAAADAETREPSSAASSGVLLFDGDSSGLPCNMGSVGHPSLCSRPCLYFATGQCGNGKSCEFCHMAHAKRPSHLNKQHREQLRDMDGARAKALILPIVRAKALAFNASEGTALAVERLAAACGTPGAPRARLSRSERSLSVALGGMNLRLLLVALQRAALQGEPAAETAAEALLTQLRSVA